MCELLIVVAKGGCMYVPCLRKKGLAVSFDLVDVHFLDRVVAVGLFELFETGLAVPKSRFFDSSG